MRTKRLQHVADTMCQMFCDWRLIGSKPSLVSLGSGTLEIDTLTGKCSFEGKSIGQLTVAEEIRAWMYDDLRANGIPIKALTTAQLSVKLSFSGVLRRSGPLREIFYYREKAIEAGNMNRCVMECESRVTTDGTVYRSQLTAAQEWPMGWPETGVKKS
jgi:hypothetical protein